jgi:hypothetical protein
MKDWRGRGGIPNMCFLLLKCSKGNSEQNNLNSSNNNSNNNNNNNAESSRALKLTDITR